MLLTTKEDFDNLKLETGMTWEEISSRTDKTVSGVRAATTTVQNFVPQSYVKIIEAMGYDIKLRFVKR